MGKTTQRRLQEMLALLGQRAEMDVPTLAERLSVSEATIRRDLATLEKSGKLIRTFGGARLREESSLVARTFGEKRLYSRGEKEQIARAAAVLVEPGMVVALDTGTTVWRVAAALRGKGPLTILTSSLPVIEELGAVDANKIICAGGEFRAENLDFVGTATTTAFDRLRADIVFLGADSLIPGQGLFSMEQESANTIVILGRIADRRIVVADHSKFTKKGVYLALKQDDIGCVITDAGIDAETREQLSSAPYELIIAE